MERISEQPWNSSYTYQVNKHSAEMLHNLNTQRKNGGRFCDVVLRVGEESFPAHRAVLAACSEYFESVFSCQADGDGEAKDLEMHTISPKVFKDILDFAYTSRIVVRLECFPELMTAAKFLLMRSVIEICQEVIKQSNVQILVPPTRPDLALFRTGGGAGDLGFPLDMSNGAGLLSNGSVFGSNGQAHEVDAGGRAGGGASLSGNGNQSGMPVLQQVERLPVNSQELGGFQGMAGGSQASGGGGKRGRGRPKKIPPMDPLLFGNSGVSKDLGIFPCGLCGKIFTEAVRLRHHEAQHAASSGLHGGGGNPGGGGGTSTGVGVGVGAPSLVPQPASLLENGLGLHVSVDSSRKRERTRRHVGCDICGKVFRDVYHLNRHKLSHSGEKPYACPVCGLRFKRKDRMSYHVRSHDGSVGKPYVCQSCGKGFSRPDHLNGHIKQVHTSERPHKCQTCNASFATRDRLRSHLACHEDKIPCQVCGKFLRAAYMSDHLKKHTEGPHNYCSICNKGFSTASYLKVHVKTHHNGSSGAGLAPGAPDPRQEPAFPAGRTCAVEGKLRPYPMPRPHALEDLCSSRRLLVNYPEVDGRFRGLPPPAGLPPCPPPLGLQPELLLGKTGAPYLWECRAAAVPGFAMLGQSPDGQEDMAKCPHQDSQESSDASFGELSDGGDLKSHHHHQHKGAAAAAAVAGGGEEDEEEEAAAAVLGYAGIGGSSGGSGRLKHGDPDKKHSCPDCGHSFRSKSYLNKHIQKAHVAPQKGLAGAPGALGDLAPALGSPFSPQQNMSLLESFGFQIVQSAFASSLVDAEAGHSGMGLGGK
ncbi:POZ-, AT hook-, and zinc finger-containing protein 1 isoform X2 [Amia ocellicauda]|uniref:POZ-, AT hook-, and zinc finger-containing protein 1 isoform X2 n=1 Tax=Amia ocellicauda TaxID=2972642 RepID=UPI0034639614